MDKKIYEELKLMRQIAVAQTQLMRSIHLEIKNIRRIMENGDS